MPIPDSPKKNRLTCDMLLLYFHTRASLGKTTPWMSRWDQAWVYRQLPILLAEYTFRTKEDISDYLKLLSTVRPYFQSIIKLEKQKSQSGLFMSDTTLDRILKQCHSFVANPDSNYMDDIFAQKLKAFSNPAFNSEDQKKLCTYHHKLILTEVIPCLSGTGRQSGKSSRYRQKAAGAWHFLRVGVNITSTCCKARQEPMYLSDKLKKAVSSAFVRLSGDIFPAETEFLPDRQAESMFW